ncbi:MAG: DUF2490 domain-containing protein [Paludibacteraceae bacterium]|nr:DUF2490 domain-containing protein [Paludibacteraceae bacterium]
MVNFKRHILLPLLLATGLCAPSNLMADDQDFATDLSLGIKKDLTKRLDFSLGAGARLKNNSSELDRFSAEGGFSVAAIKKWVDLDAGYVFIADWNGPEDEYYSYRHRYNIGLDLYHKLGKRLTWDVRCKWQSSYRSEKMKTYKWDPKDYIRVRGGLDYKIKGLPLNAYASAEAFCSTNNPDGNDLDNMRYNLGVKYHLNKKNTFDLGFQVDDEMHVSKPKDRFMLCVGYKFKL